MYRKELKGINEVYHEVAALFDNHPDLLDDFTKFLPDASAAHNARQSSHRYDERSAAIAPPKQAQIDKVMQLMILFNLFGIFLHQGLIL